MNARAARLCALAALLALPAVRAPAAGTADAAAALAAEQHQIQTADYRITGRLVHVQSNGARVSAPVVLMAHWFPGVLRIALKVGNAPSADTAPDSHFAVHVLLEMHPGGANTIWVAHPGDKAPALLAFEKWSDGPLGPGFAYEDFLEQQYFWLQQTLAPPAKFGARDCDVVLSAPGTGARTHYAQVQTWLAHDIGSPVYAEKTFKSTGAVKQFTYSGLRHNGGVWSASQVEEQTRGQAEKWLLLIDRGSAKANLTLKDFSLDQLARF
jgi:hypothetical protein